MRTTSGGEFNKNKYDCLISGLGDDAAPFFLRNVSLHIHRYTYIHIDAASHVHDATQYRGTRAHNRA